MNITSAKYEKELGTNEITSITVVIDGITSFVPLDPYNRHYEEILKQVEAGTLTIKDAE